MAFEFEAPAQVVKKTGEIAVWTDGIGLFMEKPDIQTRLSLGPPAYTLELGKRYRITVEQIN